MAGEQPVMAFEIQYPILKFSVRGFVRFFDDSGHGVRALVVGFYVFNEDGETLRFAEEFRGA